ncbi:hypothetical protein Q4489_04430 [Thalassotalea sp. 1_MG-2023]|uniref:hypothetical protein n=1 Tax=Thalassotalea sp. 1_MG-2023 TaxID=3062680 RepID=UPI0026E448AE|nr:hypothetical protein [Thalassotalea sp. 1_MG-2023]MDO6426244.1 hypothetical protein [Thalassotalea sp. 1_MG-2023]
MSEGTLRASGNPVTELFELLNEDNISSQEIIDFCLTTKGKAAIVQVDAFPEFIVSNASIVDALISNITTLKIILENSGVTNSIASNNTSLLRLVDLAVNNSAVLTLIAEKAVIMKAIANNDTALASIFSDLANREILFDSYTASQNLLNTQNARDWMHNNVEVSHRQNAGTTHTLNKKCYFLKMYSRCSTSSTANDSYAGEFIDYEHTSGLVQLQHNVTSTSGSQSTGENKIYKRAFPLQHYQYGGDTSFYTTSYFVEMSGVNP